jgi:putative PEP-CTERM system TPR-repeat lipoprotein
VRNFLQTCLRYSLFLLLMLSAACGKTDLRSVDEILQAAKQKDGAGDYRAAIIEYRNVLQKQPENLEARLRLGQAYLKFKLGNEAEAELKIAEKGGVERDALLVSLGEALLLLGKYQEMLDTIKPGENTPFDVRAQVVRLRADAFYALRKTEDACSAYQEALQQDNSLVQAIWGLANCAHVRNDFVQAEQLLKDAIVLEPDNADSYIRLGDVQRMQNHFSDAEASFSKAVQLAPNNAIAYVNRAGARLALNRDPEAVEDIKIAARYGPNSELVVYMQALLDYRSKRYLAAQEKLLPILKTSPWHFQTVLLYGQVTYALGYFKSAEVHLHRLLDITPNSVLVRTLVASSQLKQGQPAKALATLKPLLDAKEDDALFLATAGDAYQALKQHAQAQAMFERALKSAPKDPAIRASYAQTLLQQNARGKALDEFRRASELSPEWLPADTSRLTLMIEDKAYDKALAELAAMPKSKTEASPEAENMLAMAYKGKGDIESARTHLKTALKLKSDFHTAALNLAFLEMEAKRPDAARTVLEKLIKKHPDNLEAYLGRAAIEKTLNRPKEYVEWLEKAASAAPRSPIPQQRLAQYYLQQKDLNKALLQAKTLQGAMPDNTDNLRLLANVQLAMGDMDNAILSLYRIVSLEPDSEQPLIELAPPLASVGRFKDARENLHKALQIKPDSVAARTALIRVHIQEKQLDAALAVARELTSKFPSVADGHTLTGDVYMWLERYEDAIRAYEASLRTERSGSVAISLFKALRGAGKSDQAQRHLAQSVNQQPEDHALRLYLAAVMREEGNPKDALPHYQYILSKQPADGIALNEYALALQKLKDPQTKAIAEKAYQVMPTPATADTLAVILLELGDVQGGLKLLEKVMTTSSPKPETRYHYAQALASSGQKSKATQELRKVLGGETTPALRTQATELMRRLQ